MSTVHAKATVPASRTAAVRSSRKKDAPLPQISCAECKLVNDCDCLDGTRLLDAIAPLARRLVDMLLMESAVIEDDFLDQIVLLLDRNDQRGREWDAWPDLGDAEDTKCDRVLVEDLVGPWGYTPSITRTVEGVAALRKVPVDRVRALLDTFLRNSRPEAIAAPATASRRAA